MEDIIPTVNQENEEEARNHVSINVMEKLFNTMNIMLQELPPHSTEHAHYIYRVFPRLRNVKPEAYTPQVVSIGPFHRGEARLQAMEVYKLRHLKAFLVRTRKSLRDFLEMVIGWEQVARNCYAETFDHLKSDEFVKMILMDGCFIVELLLSLNEERVTLSSVPMVEQVIVDMILLENQLPFVVLDNFYNLVPDKNSSFRTVVHGHQFFKNLPNINNKLPDEIKHFVDFMHHCYVSSFPDAQPQAQHQGNARYKYYCPLFLISYLRGCYLWLFPKAQQEIDKNERPPSVTVLHQAGIKFKKGTGDSLLGIKFSNGILEIPQLVIEDRTDSLFRNLIAFEQYHHLDNCVITSYFVLLDGLINTSKDVDLLIHEKIIVNMLGSSEEVSTLFNNMCKEVVSGFEDSPFFPLSQQLNAYYRSTWHRWRATLRRDYFNTPWTTISVITAVVLLVLTFIQSYCSIKSL